MQLIKNRAARLAIIAALLLIAGSAFAQSCNLFAILKTGQTCRSASQSFYTNIISGASYQWTVPGTSFNQTTSSNNITINNSQFSPGTYTMSVTATCGTACNCTTGSASTTFTISPFLCPATGGDGSEEAAGKASHRFSGRSFEPVSPTGMSALIANGGNYWAFAHGGDRIELANLMNDANLVYLAMVDKDDKIQASLIDLAAGEARAIELIQDVKAAYLLSLQPFALYLDGQEAAVQEPRPGIAQIIEREGRAVALDAAANAHFPLFGMTIPSGDEDKDAAERTPQRQ